jgi:predicted transcriptional regulator
MSQSTLAQKASISQPYVCQIETGLQTPGVNTLLKIMDILLIDPADIPQFTEVSE